LFRCCFPCAGGAPPAPGFQGNSTSGLRLFQALSLSAAALAMPNSLPNSESKQAGAAGNRSPAKSHLTKPPAKPASPYIKYRLSADFDIFSSGFYVFLLLRFSRKPFAQPQKPFRKISGSGAQGGRPAFKNPALGRDF